MAEPKHTHVTTDPKLMAEKCMAALGDPEMLEKLCALPDAEAAAMWQKNRDNHQNFKQCVHNLKLDIIGKKKRAIYTLKNVEDETWEALQNFIDQKNPDIKKLIDTIRHASIVYHHLGLEMERKSGKSSNAAPAIAHAAMVASQLDALQELLETPGLSAATSPVGNTRQPEWLPPQTWDGKISAWNPDDPLNSYDEGAVIDDPEAVASQDKKKPAPKMRRSHITEDEQLACNKCLASLGDKDAAEALSAMPAADILDISAEMSKAWPTLQKMTKTPSHGRRRKKGPEHEITVRTRTESKTYDLDANREKAIEIVKKFFKSSFHLLSAEEKMKLIGVRDMYRDIGAEITRRYDDEDPAENSVIVAQYTATVASQINAVLLCAEKREREDPCSACLAMLGDENMLNMLRRRKDEDLNAFAGYAQSAADTFHKVLEKEGVSTILVKPHLEHPPSFNFKENEPKLCRIIQRIFDGALVVPKKDLDRLQLAANAYQAAADALNQLTKKKPTPDEQEAIDFARDMVAEMNAVLDYVEHNKAMLKQGKKPRSELGL